jgi:hypothetical protein
VIRNILEIEYFFVKANLEILNGISRISGESLSRNDAYVEGFGLFLEVIDRRREHFLVVLNGGDFLPLVEFAEFETSRIVEDGRRMSTIERLKASTV